MSSSQSRVLVYFASTLLALLAFAGNSVLCRLALQESQIDAASFTIVRLVSGALTLLFIVKLMQKSQGQLSDMEDLPTIIKAKVAWFNGLMLFIYAACFSFAYIMLDAGLGALILFACVQLSMITYSIYKKQALSPWQYLGLFSAFTGLLYLVFSQSSANTIQELNFSLLGFILMSIAGLAWAAYTIAGKNSQQAIVDTSINFSRSCVFLLPLCLAYLFIDAHMSIFGVSLAIASGAICSGLGYAIWYYALNGLQAVQAGVVQLLVPVIAALGGVIWIDEIITYDIMISQVIILGGIALVIFLPAKKNTV